jgi:hypothetical protein
MEQLQLENRGGENSHVLSEITRLPQAQQKEELENLLYYKAKQGQDVGPILQALYYFDSKNMTKNQLEKMWTEAIKERSVFNSLQKVVITAFAILGMIALLNGLFSSARSSHALIVQPARIQGTCHEIKTSALLQQISFCE